MVQYKGPAKSSLVRTNKIRNELLRPLVSVGIVIGLWSLISQVVNNQKLFPSISHTLSVSLPSFSNFSFSGRFSTYEALLVISENTFISILRILSGGSVGTLLGIICGLMLHFFQLTRPAARVLLVGMRTVPLLTLIPLFLFWFGGKEIGVHIWIAFACFIVMATTTSDAVLNVSPTFICLAEKFGASRRKIFSTIILPAVLPEILTGLRTTLGLSWMFCLGAEYLVAQSGLGFLVSQSYMFVDMGKLLLLLFLYGVLGLTTFTLSGFIFNKMTFWRED